MRRSKDYLAHVVGLGMPREHHSMWAMDLDMGNSKTQGRGDNFKPMLIHNKPIQLESYY